MGIIQAAIPLLFPLIAVELLWSRVTGRRPMRPTAKSSRDVDNGSATPRVPP